MHLVYRCSPLTDDTLERVIDIENEHTGRTYRFEGHRARPEDAFEVRVDEALQEDLYRQAAKIAPHSQRPGDVFIRQDGQTDYEAFFLVPAGPKPYSLNCVLTFFGQAVSH